MTSSSEEIKNKQTIGINERLLGNHLFDLPEYVVVGSNLVDSDGFCPHNFYFGTIQECKRISGCPENWLLENKKIFFHDLRVSSFLPSVQDLCLNFKDSCFKMVCQLDDKDIGGFCRSDSGEKVWSGQLLDNEMIKIIKQTLASDDMLFLSPARKISDIEYRCWVGDGELIAYDTYCVGDINSTEPINDDTLKQLQGFVALLEMFYSPDQCYVVDVCRADDELLVVEYNCFSTSSFCPNNASLLPVLEFVRNNEFKKCNDIFNRVKR